MTRCANADDLLFPADVPECFRFVTLAGASYGSHHDYILNTLASRLIAVEHSRAEPGPSIAGWLEAARHFVAASASASPESVLLTLT